ncbi:DUF177 domain-containing protein [Candidatus Gracilibacteria bacterium]|nr:DUF177 domain-containing protein [Candidatus Gracilibacteria bacterium]
MTILKFNVAQLLRELIGARRDHEFIEASLPLDETLVLRDIHGNVRFTRTATGVFAQVRARGVVRLTCVRSLEEFDETVDVTFEDQFHSVIDVVTGAGLPTPAEEDPFMLDELHMADIGEALRAYVLLELPLNPVSPGHRDTIVNYSVASDGIVEADDGAPIDARFEALKAWAERQNDQSS